MRVAPVVGAIVVAVVWTVSVAFAEKGDAGKGKETCAKLCASRHGTTGKGDGPAAAALNPKARDLTDKASLATVGHKYLFDIIAKGGAAVGKSPLMSPYGVSLKENDIWNVVAYVRSLGT